jgi:hypothetical protein
MAWTTTDLAYKILVNRQATSSGKQYYEELGDYTINVSAAEIWSQNISSTPATAVSQGIAALYTSYVLTEDVSVGSHQCWNAGGLENWISPKYGSGYTVHLYQNNGSEIFPTDASQWFFNYQTGILTFNSAVPASQPLKLTGYRYIGRMGVGGANNAYSDLPVEATDGSRVLFTLHNNFSTGTTRVFLNGVRQAPIYDYNEVLPNQIQFNNAPYTNDRVLADYEKA